MCEVGGQGGGGANRGYTVHQRDLDKYFSKTLNFGCYYKSCLN